MPAVDHFRHTPALLMIAGKQKEDLCLKSVARPVAVEIRQKRILLEHLEQNLRIERRLQQAGQGGLADANDSFDGNVHASLRGME